MKVETDLETLIIAGLIIFVAGDIYGRLKCKEEERQMRQKH